MGAACHPSTPSGHYSEWWPAYLAQLAPPSRRRAGLFDQELAWIEQKETIRARKGQLLPARRSARHGIETIWL